MRHDPKFCVLCLSGQHQREEPEMCGPEPTTDIEVGIDTVARQTAEGSVRCLGVGGTRCDWNDAAEPGTLAARRRMVDHATATGHRTYATSRGQEIEL